MFMTTTSHRILNSIISFSAMPLRHIASLLNSILNKCNIFIIYRDGNAVGDQLCITALARELFRTFRYRLIVFATYPQFFEHNPYVITCVSLNSLPAPIRRLYITVLKTLTGPNVVKDGAPAPTTPSEVNELLRLRKTAPLVIINTRHFQQQPRWTDLRPELYFSPSEMSRFHKQWAHLPRPYALVQSEGKTSFTPNKEWGADKFQHTISLIPQIQWVQIGDPSHARLAGALDLRGHTSTLRELAYVISQAHIMLCLEGLYNHIAACFNINAYVIFSGFSNISLATYPNTIPIQTDIALDCLGCFLETPCPVPGKPCTERIQPHRVAQLIASRQGWPHRPHHRSTCASDTLS